MRIVLTYLILVGACINSLIPDCSTISGRSDYANSIVVDKPFEDININQGDSVYISLEYFIHIYNRYTGDEACESESYESRPIFRASVSDESKVFQKIYEDPNGVPRYDEYESEVKLKIIGLKQGSAIINLEAGFLEDDYGEVYFVGESYQINVNVD